MHRIHASRAQARNLPAVAAPFLPETRNQPLPHYV